MTDDAIRKPEFQRPAWWEIAEALMLARYRGLRNMPAPNMPSNEDINLAREIVLSRRNQTRGSKRFPW